MNSVCVLWLCNVPTRRIAQEMGIQPAVSGGWLENLNTAAAKQKGGSFHYCFFSIQVPAKQEGMAGDIHYHTISYADTLSIEKATKALEGLLQDVKPDIIHIFGSEYITSYAMALACQKRGLLDRTLLHIQGLVSVSAQHYDLGIPWYWKRLMMPRDFLRNASIARGKKDFKRCGIYEEEAIKLLKHISGRTDWDKACAYHINPQAAYHFCNETLRESFYQHRWDINNCERHSIFVSQGNYPIKGLHFLLVALPLILKHYPDTRLYIGGSDPTVQKGSLKDKFKRTSYGQYLLHLIKRHDLGKHVVFTGPFDEQRMCDRFLKSHVFVSPSTIENSPNSLGEAMILGLPCIASFVGGVSNMLKDKEEGFLYQADAPYMLAYYVMSLFENDDTAIKMGNQARLHALKTHSVETNSAKLLDIYQYVNNGSGTLHE